MRLREGACVCERALGMRAATPGGDTPAYCGPGSQPSLPGSARPLKQDPQGPLVLPSASPQPVPALPFGAYGTLGGAWVGTQLIEANSASAHSACTRHPLVWLPGALPSLGLSARLGHHPTREGHSPGAEHPGLWAGSCHHWVALERLVTPLVYGGFLSVLALPGTHIFKLSVAYS